MKNIYFRYLQFVSSDAIHQSKQEVLSSTAILLLNRIAVKEYEEKPMNASIQVDPVEWCENFFINRGECNIKEITISFIKK